MFDQYRKARCSAVFSNIPIERLEEFRKVYPAQYKIRYRGPRNSLADRISRSWLSRQSTCLQRYATSFSAYLY